MSVVLIEERGMDKWVGWWNDGGSEEMFELANLFLDH